MQQALDALNNSVDLVREDAYNAEKLYGNYPTRQGKVGGLKVLADDHEKAITALRDRLAQPEQGPVAWRTFDGDNGYNYIDYENNKDYCYWLEELHSKHKGWGEPLYTTPPVAQQRPWVGLTEPELHEINPTWPAPGQHWDYKTVLDFVRAIETKLKEKNT
jgi:hypothetical protein